MVYLLSLIYSSGRGVCCENKFSSPLRHVNLLAIYQVHFAFSSIQIPVNEIFIDHMGAVGADKLLGR
jgi:hypothetical protein